MDNTSTPSQTPSNLTEFHAEETERPNDIAPLLKKQCTESPAEEETAQIPHQMPSFNDTCAGDPAEALFSLCPAAHELPLRPPPFDSRLCVIGLASTHVALGKKPEVKAVDFNVGKSSRSDIKVTGKRKKVYIFRYFVP